jgi:hypothetical protein
MSEPTSPHGRTDQAAFQNCGGFGMKKVLFDELLESVKQAREIVRRERAPSREFFGWDCRTRPRAISAADSAKMKTTTLTLLLLGAQKS